MSKAVIVYDSRTGSTETMARAIEEGCSASGKMGQLEDIT